ncbi:C-type lectin domain family 12 member B-like [Pyxicephalus adspersus]|uniref:C-type lectin domain family 12 member B-like n=1 Tax=Pyxicephalus adspersus TaxID=30357 RepID=UPI003B5BE0C0
MADGVTYADLTFAGIVLQKPKSDGSTPEDHTEHDDVKYENIADLHEKREKRPPLAPPAPSIGRCCQPITGIWKNSPHLSLVALFLCLALSIVVIGLAVKYLEVSNELLILNSSLMNREKILRSLRKELAAIKTELESAVQGNVQLNSSLQQFQRGFCPEGWVLFKQKCLWFSDNTDSWDNSSRNCGLKDSNLIILQRNDTELQDFLEKQGEFWAGKEIKWIDHAGERRWPTNYPQVTQHNRCWKTIGRNLQNVSCTEHNRWICQRNVVVTLLKKYSSSSLAETLSFTVENAEFYCYGRSKSR